MKPMTRITALLLMIITIGFSKGSSGAPPAQIKGRRAAAKENALKKWSGKNALSKQEISKDEFLSAAVRFADTVVQYGRDVYGPEHTPLFANYIHIDYLKAPRALSSMRKTPGWAPHPLVFSKFDRQQNLLRLLAHLSLITGDRKYVEAACDATQFMFDRYWVPRDGLLIFGNHREIDLVSGRVFGTKGNPLVNGLHLFARRCLRFP